MTYIQIGTVIYWYCSDAVLLVALQYYVQVQQYGSSNSHEHACLFTSYFHIFLLWCESGVGGGGAC